MFHLDPDKRTWRTAALVLPAITFAVGALLAGCGQRKALPPDPARADEGLATAVLALGVRPDDVTCIVIRIRTTTEFTRHETVSGPAQTDVVLKDLPLGVAVFSVEAFASATCAPTEPNAVPTWVGGPASALLRSGHNTIQIPMRRNSQTTVSLDFDGGAPPTCAPAGSACLPDSAGPCCLGHRCEVESGQTIGNCRPTPTADAGMADAMPAPSVTREMAGGVSYLFYPLSGAPNCPGADGAGPYIATVPRGQTLCLESGPQYDTATVLRLREVEVCEAGFGCQECTDDSCNVLSCFPRARMRPAGTTCTGRGLLGLTAQSRFIVIPRGVSYAEGETLPRLFFNSEPSILTVTPPADQSRFAIVRIGDREFGESTDPDACGANGLCGLIEYRAFTSMPRWIFLAPGLQWAPIF
jgi:hypothetical protein